MPGKWGPELGVLHLAEWSAEKLKEFIVNQMGLCFEESGSFVLFPGSLQVVDSALLRSL
jgi:hypothetical protein